MRKIIFAILLIISVQTNLFSQVNQDWIRKYGSSANQVYTIAGIETDKSGNVFVTASVTGATLTDYHTIKYNSSGDIQWAKIYTGLIEDRVIDMILDNSGNVCVTGLSENTTGTYDIITIKYNTNGDSLWVKRYNGPTATSMDQPVAMTVDNINNVYVCGYSFGTTTMSYVTIKYSPQGDSVWTQRFVIGGTNIPQDIFVDESGNVIVYGRGTTVLKYNANGNLLWSKSYSTDAAESKRVLIGDNSGNIYFGGTNRTVTFDDFSMTKINSNGDTLWMRSRNGLGNTLENHDEVNSVAIDNTGNVYSTGKSYYQLSSYFSTIKYNSSGVFQWEKIYLHPQNGEGGKDIVTDNSGNIYVTGGSNDFTTIKYNSNGDSLWSMIYNGPSNLVDFSEAMTIDNTGNVYVTGRSRQAGTPQYYEIATLKYSQTLTGTSGVNSNNEYSFKLYQNYPNPFNPVTNLNFEIPEQSFVSLKIYDLSGKKVDELLNEVKPSGNYSVQFNASVLSSGIYFYTLKVNGYSETKRMILLK